MFLSDEEEQISLHLDNGELTRSPLMHSNPISIDVLSSAIGLPESPKKLAGTFPEANVAPEHEKIRLEQNIKDLEGEIASLKTKEKSLNEKRRGALNKLLDIKGCIRVLCRIRPFLSTDRIPIQQPILVESDRIVIKSGANKKEFGFDKVFYQDSSQEDVFAEVEPILRSALDGNNVCMLAYGQTGTGKTYTMDGTNETPGIIPRVLKSLFSLNSLDSSTSLTYSISMVEVYLGNLRDLLAPKPSGRIYAVSRSNPTIQIDAKGLVEIEGLTEVPISNYTKANWWYAKGRRVRSTSWTNVNEASSRSHCLTRITIYNHGDATGGKAEVSKLWMVDLGGSERLLKTGAIGQTLDEGRAINLSLSALGDVIAALRRKKVHVPYRNSKLTQILRDSLGNGSKVVMLVHVSPKEEDVAETVCSVSFAKRARAVECTREHSEELKRQKEKRIVELEDEMKEAEVESEKLRKQILKAEFLLSENTRILSTTCQTAKEEEDEEGKIPQSPKDHFNEILETPKESTKTVRKTGVISLPRFMDSTVASRQRKSIAEKQISGKVRNFRSETRSSIQISGSQSHSYSGLKAILKNSNKRPRYGELKNSLTEDGKHNSLEPYPRPSSRGTVVSSTDPNLRVALCRHRRRVSDFM